MADHLGGLRELDEAFSLCENIVGGRQHRAVLFSFTQSRPTLHHAADFSDGVITLVEPVAPQDLEEHERIAGGQRVNRQRPALKISYRFHVRCGHETKKAGVATHESEKFRLWPDRGLALS